MKKRSLITLVTVFFAVLTLTAFYACSADEGAPETAQPTAKADILRAKAKEFAKKYGVNMTLNEDKIDSLAQVLTVEQMEEDFKALSTAKFELKMSQPSKLVRRGLKIRSNKTLEEERNETYSGNAPFDFSLRVKYITTEEDTEVTHIEAFSGRGTVSWTLGLQTSNSVTVSMSSDDGRLSGSSRMNTNPTNNSQDFKSGTFEASGILHISVEGYSLRKSIKVTCAQKTASVTIR